MPNRDVKKRVALKAVLRPMRSEPIKLSSKSDVGRPYMHTHTFPSLPRQTSYPRTWRMRESQYNYLGLKRADMGLVRV